MDRFEVRVSITRLLLVLLIVIVPLSVVGYILTIRSDRSLDNAIGSDYKALAQTYSNEVSEYVRDRVADVSAMALDSTVVNAVTSANRSGGASAAAEPGPKGGPGSVASQILLQRKTLDPRFLSIVATDQAGNPVASTQQLQKSSYAQAQGWQSVYNKGEGAVKISSLLYNELAKSYYVDVGVPIADPNSAHVIGVLAAYVDISPLLARFQENQIANGARAELVNGDGSVIGAPNANMSPGLKSQQYDVLHDSLGSLQGRPPGWQVATLSNGPYLVGYAAEHLDNLNWVVLVSREEHQAVAAVTPLERFAIAMVVMGIFMLTLLCVYYFLHRAQRFEDIEQAAPAEPQDRAAAASI